MNKHFLEIIHKTVLARSIKCNYNMIPTQLQSLQTKNPTDKQLDKDYSKIAEHFKHPVFIGFIPSYDKMIENKYNSWLCLYAKRHQ